jgi:hypothetical protein
MTAFHDFEAVQVPRGAPTRPNADRQLSSGKAAGPLTPDCVEKGRVEVVAPG